MKKLSARWWVEGGTEVCDVCAQRYAYQLEYRCYDCDSPICPVCVITVRQEGRSYCPGCGPGAQEE